MNDDRTVIGQLSDGRGSQLSHEQASQHIKTMPGGKASSAPIIGNDEEPTIFELSSPGRTSWQLRSTQVPQWSMEELVPVGHRRAFPVSLAEVSERDLVAHYTRLTHRQFSVDLGAYPLGSCTMKYNPKICDAIAGMPGLAEVHPGAPPELVQGWLEVLVQLEESLCEITGMQAATLQPAAGAAGELTGLLLMRAYHEDRADQRRRVIIPDSAHGTNPASVTLGGYEVTTVASDSRGCVDIEGLREALDTDVAGIMLTNPNTLGLFEEEISQIASLVHDVGGLLYYDGANLNAILGVVRPGDMGFDIVHMNLHKTFATPHGSGGPGAGPVAVSERLVDFLPGPRPVRLTEGKSNWSGGGFNDEFAGEFGWMLPTKSIGRVHSWHGNALVLARALGYVMVNGADGLRRVAQRAVLNANWIRKRLEGIYDVPYDRVCMHEVVIAATTLKKTYGVSALDIAKCLLDAGFHSPTVYFPLIVEEALMIEPSETESLQTLQALADALENIALGAKGGVNMKNCPMNTPVRRIDEARAARKLIATFDDR